MDFRPGKKKVVVSFVVALFVGFLAFVPNSNCADCSLQWMFSTRNIEFFILFLPALFFVYGQWSVWQDKKNMGMLLLQTGAVVVLTIFLFFIVLAIAFWFFPYHFYSMPTTLVSNVGY